MLSIKYSHTLDNYHKNDYNHKNDYICTNVSNFETFSSFLFDRSNRRRHFFPGVMQRGKETFCGRKKERRAAKSRQRKQQKQKAISSFWRQNRFDAEILSKKQGEKKMKQKMKQ